ncbi:MAG: hypothetical protein ACLU8C_13195 [Lacrimispora saccharolytica]
MAELVEIDASDLRREKNMYRIADRNGKIKEQNSAQDRLLEWLYGHCVGRLLLRPLISPAVSKLGGKILSSRPSSLLIRPFVRASGMDLSDYEQGPFDSYNDFFSEKSASRRASGGYGAGAFRQPL